MLRDFKNFIHLLEAVLANVWYGFPSRKLTMVGVTGTDGKTTTTSMIYHILKSDGKKVAMITTLGAYIGDDVYDVGFHVTTPSSFAIQKYLKKAVDEGNSHVVLEVTSHALDQNRPWGIHFALAVLTNITHEHLDYHKTYTQYVHAKAKLLKNADRAICNADDESFEHLSHQLNKKQIIPYGIQHKQATETLKNNPAKTTLLGSFNTYNALAASVTCKYLGVTSKKIEKALLSFTAPKGRQDVVYDKLFTVMIDFAHTPNAFYQILPELKKKTKGRLIHVFGSASERDESKRPVMGKASSQFADIIILTAEDPRKESIEKICEEIKTGITGFSEYDKDLHDIERHERNVLVTIPDRKEAIFFALALAQKGDTVLLTGKSHETSMNYGNGEEPWNEFEVVKEGLGKVVSSK